MRRTIVFIAVLCVISTGIIAQDAENAPVGQPVANEIGTDTAQQNLRQVSVSKFEDAAFWYGSMSRDYGIVQIRRLEGVPLDKEPIPDEEELGIEEEDKFVLGTKVSYYKRAYSSFSIHPVKPLPIEGITKTVSVWVVGRNNNHTLKLLVEDYFGNRAEITMGKLNFSGWKELTVAIPPTLVQRDYHYNNRMGIKILGFEVECDPAETYGSYYIYFDGLRAVTDLFAEVSRDVDDIPDSW